MDVFSSLECTGTGLLTKKRAFSLKKGPGKPYKARLRAGNVPSHFHFSLWMLFGSHEGFFIVLNRARTSDSAPGKV